MQMKPYGVYVKTDSVGRITAVNSEAFIRQTDDWVKIDDGFGDRFHHAQGNYFPDGLYDGRGICRYKLVSGNVVMRSKEEMDRDDTPHAAIPTAQDDTDAMLVDHEYRLTMLELGITE